uniref:Uncharacterized protein n=1 Tax=Ditylenchus dipsaci TaxID=166011 RepID=A0A915CNL2_9BILA
MNRTSDMDELGNNNLQSKQASLFDNNATQASSSLFGNPAPATNTLFGTLQNSQTLFGNNQNQDQPMETSRSIFDANPSHSRNQSFFVAPTLNMFAARSGCFGPSSKPSSQPTQRSGSSGIFGQSSTSSNSPPYSLIFPSKILSPLNHQDYLDHIDLLYHRVNFNILVLGANS